MGGTEQEMMVFDQMEFKKHGYDVFKFTVATTEVFSDCLLKATNVVILHWGGHGDSAGFAFSGKDGSGFEQMDPVLSINAIVSALETSATFGCIFLNMCQSAVVAERLVRECRDRNVQVPM